MSLTTIGFDFVDQMQNRQLYRVYDLYRIGRTIAEGNKAEVQRKILEQVVSGFEASSGCIALLEKNRDSLNIVTGVGHPANFVGSVIKVGEGIMGWVAEKGRPLLLNGDVVNDPRFSNLARKSERPRSAMCWPLRVENKVIGVLSINRQTEQSSFTEEDLEQGNIMINIVGVVIDNTRLHVERQNQMHALKAANVRLEKINKKLRDAQQQVLQADKMASIGQLAAGVAHEINNPVGYINSNIGTLKRYVVDLFRLLDAYEETLSATSPAEGIRALKDQIDLDYSGKIYRTW